MGAAATSDQPSDQELVAAANAGDASAIETLYLRYRDWVVGRAARICGRHDALDVLQETFIYVIGKFPGFELTCQFKTFLYPVVKNVALAKLRAQGRTVPLDDAVPELAAPVALAAAEAEKSNLAEQVRALPTGQQEVIVLRYADGLSQAEIAQALSIPIGTVKSRLHHALSRLRRKLGQE